MRIAVAVVVIILFLIVFAGVVAGGTVWIAKLIPPVNQPSLSMLIEKNCGSFLEKVQFERYHRCEDQMINSYQLAYGSIPDGE